MSPVDRRPLGWSPLADSDPVPGDPDAVRGLAGRYAAAAEQAADQVRSLRLIAGSASTDDAIGWSGPAAQAFEARAAALPPDLAAVSQRFDRIGQALRDYAPALESAQRRAGRARAAAQSVPTEPASARPPAVTVLPPLFDTPENEQLVRARRELAAACEERDRAAVRCARALAQAGHDALRNPSRWHRMLGTVSSWAGNLSSALGVAALLLCWVPGLGETLGALSLGLALVKLGADLGLAATGDRGWPTLLGDTLAVLPVGKAARLGSAMSRETALARAADRAAGTRRWQVRQGQVLHALAGPLRFERSRGVHGLAAVRDTSLAHETRSGWAQFRVAVQVGVGSRSAGSFLRSPGGLLDEIAWARGSGPSGATWLAGSYAIDAGNVSSGWLSQHRPHRSHRSHVAGAPV
jgi:uncharacterized protein YukE